MPKAKAAPFFAFGSGGPSVSGSHSPSNDKALPYSAVFPAICQTNEFSKERDDIQFRPQKAQRSSNILTKDQLEALSGMIKSRDYTKEQSKLVLINTSVNSVLVYDNGDVYITLNCRGTDGLFLKSEAVRLQSGSVHQVKLLSNRYFISREVIGFGFNIKTGKPIDWSASLVKKIGD